MDRRPVYTAGVYGCTFGTRKEGLNTLAVRTGSVSWVSHCKYCVAITLILLGKRVTLFSPSTARIWRLGTLRSGWTESSCGVQEQSPRYGFGVSGFGDKPRKSLEQFPFIRLTKALRPSINQSINRIGRIGAISLTSRIGGATVCRLRCKNASSREHWRSIVDTATLKNSMPWRKRGGWLIISAENCAYLRTQRSRKMLAAVRRRLLLPIVLPPREDARLTSTVRAERCKSHSLKPNSITLSGQTA